MSGRDPSDLGIDVAGPIVGALVMAVVSVWLAIRLLWTLGVGVVWLSVFLWSSGEKLWGKNSPQ